MPEEQQPNHNPMFHLEGNESLLRSVIENARHFAIYRVLIEQDQPFFGRIALVSPSLSELTGIPDPYDFSRWFENIHPDDLPVILEANRISMEQALPYNQVARVYHSAQKRWRWVQTISTPGFDSAGRLTHFDGMVIDLTEQKEAELALQEVNATLEQRIRERTAEVERRREAAESLRDIIEMINAKLPLDHFLKQAVELAARRVGAAACVLHHFDLDTEVIAHVASFGLEGIFEPGARRPFNLMKASGAESYVKATLEKRPVFNNYPPLEERVNEILLDPTLPEHIKAERIRLRKKFAASFSVPLFIQNKAYGGMVFYYTEPQQFRDEQIQLGLVFSEQVALAIENARLVHEAERRRSVAESLRDTLIKLNSSSSLDEVLDFIISQADGLSDSKFLALYVLSDDQSLLEIRALRGQFPEAMRQVRLRMGEGTVGRAVAERRVLSIPNVDQIQVALSPEEIDQRQPVYVEQTNLAVLREVAETFKAVLVVPLLTQNRVYGGLAFYYPQPRQFETEEIQLASAFASQASIAIESAMLRSQAAEVAALSERNRLARDLHDAVSQTLFSASLTAEVLPRLWERNPELASQKLDELRQLTRGALSEMRTLLLELRPTSLADMDLADLLWHLSNAFTGRTRIPVEMDINGQVDLPFDVKSVFYRVAQEALNNIAKHAQATRVDILLARGDNAAQLEVTDNGRGFDPQAVSPGSLGLGIMHERAAMINAQLEIHTGAGAGARIVLDWKETQP